NLRPGRPAASPCGTRCRLLTATQPGPGPSGGCYPPRCRTSILVLRLPPQAQQEARDMLAFSLTGLTALAVDPVVWASLAALIAMEIVLGIDNLLFISIVTNRLPVERRERARRVGIGLALILRLLLLSTMAFIVTLTAPVFSVLGQGFSWHDLILIAGGLFLVWKATKEIHHHVDPDHAPD